MIAMSPEMRAALDEVSRDPFAGLKAHLRVEITRFGEAGNTVDRNVVVFHGLKATDAHRTMLREWLALIEEGQQENMDLRALVDRLRMVNADAIGIAKMAGQPVPCPSCARRAWLRMRVCAALHWAGEIGACFAAFIGIPALLCLAAVACGVTP